MAKVRIFQINDVEENIRFMFRRYSFFQDKGVEPKFEMYHIVYETNMKIEQEIDDFLEDVFAWLNSGIRPEGYTGYSLSVSDVVGVDDDYYFVNDMGFVKLQNFID